MQLISASKKCDKIVDCEDGTDEADCKCADFVKNRNPNAICDGITDCYDRSDENCVQCKENEYHCRRSHKCIDISKRCDAYPDCDRNEDEWDCVALTNGKTMLFDDDLRPKLAQSGILTINKNGVWKPLCNVSSDFSPTVASDSCYLLGYEEYAAYHEIEVPNNPLNTIDETEDSTQESKTNETCLGLYVKCSSVSLDSSIHGIHLDNVSDDVELYTSPWNAVIYSDGKYRCMGAILNSRWIVTSVNCFQGITQLNEHYVAALLGKGKATLDVKGPHEQSVRIVESKRISDTDIILLRTEFGIEFDRYVKDIRIGIRREGKRKENCVAIGIYNNKAKYEFLNPIKNCKIGSRCFEIKQKINCSDPYPWSGNIYCDAGKGWYPAAVFSEKNGLCGFSSTLQYTSLPYNKNLIYKAMESNSLNIDAPECNGFRCALGECITKNKTCNGIADCRGGEDEDNAFCYENEHECHLTDKCVCNHTELKCSDGKCIPKSKFCDTVNDCGDFSDEPDTCNCKSYLELTNPQKICDGILHCLDRSDEDPVTCPCQATNFQCVSTDHCVANDMVCDGFEDCPNGEDEKMCFNIVNKHSDIYNSGEVLGRTGGIWHSGCFNKSYTTEEINKFCFDLGFRGINSKVIDAPDDTKAMRAVIDHFNYVWIRRDAKRKFKLGLRSGNEPYVRFEPDENCYKLFLTCN